MAKKPKKRGGYRAAAIVTIRAAGEMSPRDRRQVASWLRHHAQMLELNGGNYAKRFTGRYLGA